MHNTLKAAWQDVDGAPDELRAGECPRSRLGWLAAVLIVAMGVIGGRLAYVQCVLPDGLLEVFAETTETFEEIPARDGRILSAEGATLAENEERYDLWVYYRWIEDPPNADWVKHRARTRLNPSERKVAERVAAAQADVLDRQRELWESLSETTGVSVAELAARRRRIQDRVERIWRHVEARRREGASEEAPREESGARRSPTNFWSDAWSRFWRELATPPRRQTHEALVITEQEDDHLVLEGLDAEAAWEIDTHPERYPGARIVLQSRRVYPMGDLAAHLIGNRTPLQPDEVSKETPAGESVGRSGLERSYDALLRGRHGLKRIVRNRRREVVRTEMIREPRPGQDLILTFDTLLQRRAEDLLDRVLAQQPPETGIDDESGREEPAAQLGPRGACLIALDVRSGAVLAAACAPRFDLNLLVHPDEARWQAVLDDPRRPLFPRVTQMALPPGSTFKTLSALALLADGQLDPQARFFCQGYLDRPDRDRCLVFRHYGIGHSETNLADALCRSCNVYFFTAARNAGVRPLIEWSHKLGIGQPTGIDVPGEAAGALPSPDESGAKSRRKWYPGDTLGLVIGQSSLLVTPLQMARVMAAVANDGRLVTPHLAAGTNQVRRDESFSASGLRLSAAEASGSAQIARPEPTPIAGWNSHLAEFVRDGLERVVQDRQGTGYRAVRLPDVKIAGKTGTAEVGGRMPDHAWFAGYVPADAPRVAFVVVIEHGGAGGKVAGPVAKQFVQALLELGVIEGRKTLARE